MHVQQLRVGQDGPGRGDAGRDAASRQVGLLAGEGARDLAGGLAAIVACISATRSVIVDELVIPGLLLLAVVGSQSAAGTTPFTRSVTPEAASYPVTYASLAGTPRFCPGTADPPSGQAHGPR